MAKLLLPILPALVGASVESEFAQFVERYNKQYASEEEFNERFEIFKSNRLYHEKENAKQSTYTLGINEFSDMSESEFASTHFGFSAPKAKWGGLRKVGVYKAQDAELLESDVDWVSKGAVTPVKNQGQCGSCWSFSASGALEGAWFVATNTLESISEQQFMDCSKQNSGCNGGLMDYAFQFAEDQALCTEESYPYKMRDGRCNPGGCDVAIPRGGVTGYTDVEASESALMSALNKMPVAVAIEADKAAFQSYTSGVLQKNCGTQLDHGVLAVGYGTDNGVKYWKVKNSWGASWGEKGYIRMLRGKGGQGECGILSSASFPVVDGKAPPSPSPTPSPGPSPDCEDKWSFCSQGFCDFFPNQCEKTCGLCSVVV